MHATKRLLTGLVLASALAAPSSANAQTLINGTTYDFCGGISYTFCGLAHLDITTPSAGGNASRPRGRASSSRRPSRANPNVGHTTSR